MSLCCGNNGDNLGLVFTQTQNQILTLRCFWFLEVGTHEHRAPRGCKYCSLRHAAQKGSAQKTEAASCRALCMQQENTGEQSPSHRAQGLRKSVCTQKGQFCTTHSQIVQSSSMKFMIGSQCWVQAFFFSLHFCHRVDTWVGLIRCSYVRCWRGPYSALLDPVARAGSWFLS